MLTSSHLLVLSQPDFVQYQFVHALHDADVTRSTLLQRLLNWSGHLG